VGGPGDQHNLRAGARKHPAEIRAHCSRTENGNSYLRVCASHGSE
jgi:hypothetical protein